MDALVLSVQTVSLQLVNFQFSKNVKLNLHVSPPINKQYIKTGKITATYIHLLTRSASGALNRVCIRVTANKNSNICRRWHASRACRMRDIWNVDTKTNLDWLAESTLLWSVYTYTIYSLIRVYSTVIIKKQIHTYDRRSKHRSVELSQLQDTRAMACSTPVMSHRHRRFACLPAANAKQALVM